MAIAVDVQEIDPRLIGRVWNPANRPLCWRCGKFILKFVNLDVYGLHVMCAECMRKEIEGC